MIKKLLHTDRSFALFQCPGKDATTGIIQKETYLTTLSFPGNPLSTGFYFIPFSDTGESRGILIRPDIVFEGSNFPDMLPKITSGPVHYGKKDISVPVVTRNQYLEKIKKIQVAISKGPVEKVVLSRPIKIPLSQHFDPDLFFRKSLLSYPGHFVFFVHIPGQITWMGATPELLIKKEKDALEFNALAGTRSVLENREPVSWPDKEKHEHTLVGRHILEVCHRLGYYNTEHSTTETVWSGRLAHLRTIYRIPLPTMQSEQANLISQLHPTPAIGGYPQVPALKLLGQTEDYEREYYTGFLGPWDLGTSSQFFVNLRSVQISDRHLVVYVGGGITAGSDPEEEWEETVQKSEAMLSMLK